MSTKGINFLRKDHYVYFACHGARTDGVIFFPNANKQIINISDSRDNARFKIDCFHPVAELCHKIRSIYERYFNNITRIGTKFDLIASVTIKQYVYQRFTDFIVKVSSSKENYFSSSLDVAEGFLNF